MPGRLLRQVAIVAAVGGGLAAGLWWFGSAGTPPGDHLCEITLYADRSWQPDGWVPRQWPPKNCNYVVHVNVQGGW